MIIIFNKFKIEKYHQEIVKNYINSNIITLLPDHDLDKSFIHFIYKKIEVTTNFNNIYFPTINELENIDRIADNKLMNNYFRNILIYINVKGLLNDYEEDEDNEEIIDEDDDEESFDNRLKKHFSGLFLTEKQLKGYDDAGNKITLLDNIMMDEYDSIFVFSSLYGLKIFNDKIVFNAPVSTLSEYEWIFYSCNIIDKILDYFNEDDDDEYLLEE